MTAPLLAVTAATKRFGGVRALEGVDLVAEAGQVHGVIGPNGAGKSTLIGCITGVTRLDSGAIAVAGQRVDHLSVHHRARLGMGRTFQKIRLAAPLTVFENVAAGLSGKWFASGGAGWLRVLAGLRSERIAGPVRATLAEVGLEDVADELVSSLPYGRRHFVELARALVADPRILFLDEPATGLTEAERARLAELVRRIAGRGRLVVLVEHDLALVGQLCDRVTVLEQGQRIFTGRPAEAQRDPAVVRAYLGNMTFVAPETAAGTEERHG